MKLAPDKVMHLKLGVPVAVLLAGIVVASTIIGPGYAVAAGSVAIGLGVEAYQKIRNEGVPDIVDAAASAACGVVFGLLYEGLTFFQLL